jgi:hypothetical protein
LIFQDISGMLKTQAQEPRASWLGSSACRNWEWNPQRSIFWPNEQFLNTFVQLPRKNLGPKREPFRMPSIAFKIFKLQESRNTL